MSKTIEFSFGDKNYKLQFTRKTVVEMERKGFSLSDLAVKPLSVLPMLFEGAFLAHHRYTKSDIIDEIYKRFKNKQELVEKLADMYNEPVETLLEEPEEDAEGNIDWTASW